VIPGQFDISIAGQSYTLSVSPFEGSAAGATTSKYGSSTGPSGQSYPLYSTSQGDFGVMAEITKSGVTPTLASDWAFTIGTSRDLSWSEMPSKYFRFHWPTDVVELNGAIRGGQALLCVVFTYIKVSTVVEQ
jgi:hypothetical protein